MLELVSMNQSLEPWLVAWYSIIERFSSVPVNVYQYWYIGVFIVDNSGGIVASGYIPNDIIGLKYSKILCLLYNNFKCYTQRLLD
jgi:hypothetical protein